MLSAMQEGISEERSDSSKKNNNSNKVIIPSGTEAEEFHSVRGLGVLTPWDRKYGPIDGMRIEAAD